MEMSKGWSTFGNTDKLDRLQDYTCHTVTYANVVYLNDVHLQADSKVKLGRISTPSGSCLICTVA